MCCIWPSEGSYIKGERNFGSTSEATLATLIELLEQKYGPEYRNAMDAIKGLRILIDAETVAF